MDYLIVLNVIALSVVLVFVFTDWNNGNTQDSLDEPQTKNSTMKKCPSCGKEIQSNIFRCRQCGVFVDFFRKKP